ncbi:MAG TPA: SIS domain-containing protein [Chloroflexota bacterium]
MTSTSFIGQLQAILTTLGDSQDEALDRAADSMASSIAGDRLVHLYGSGHSVIPVMDSFPRYGSFVGLNPLTDPRLMWWNVLGPGGVRPLLWLERTEGYAEQYLSTQPIRERDTMIVFSHGGRNAAPVEAAVYARDRGVRVVGVTSMANTRRPAGHSSGKRLADVSDIVIDTGVPVEDALITLDGWPAPLAGGSTVVACVVVGELISRTAAKLLERGITMPTFVSPTVPGASVETNDHVFDAFGRRLLQAEEQEAAALAE